MFISTQASEPPRSEIYQRLPFIRDPTFISIWHIDCSKTQFSMVWFIPLADEYGVYR